MLPLTKGKAVILYKGDNRYIGVRASRGAGLPPFTPIPAPTPSAAFPSTGGSPSESTANPCTLALKINN